MSKLSVRTSCFNERPTIPEIVRRVLEGIDLEPVHVDDGFTDDCAEVVVRLAEGNPSVRVVTTTVDRRHRSQGMTAPIEARVGRRSRGSGGGQA